MSVSWIEQHALRQPHNEALIDLETGHVLTYGELWARVRSIAYALQSSHDVVQGDRVAVLSRNDTRFFETMYACALLGAIVVPLNWRLTPSELGQIARDADPAVLIAESWACDAAAEIAADARASLALLGWSSERAGGDDFERLASADVPQDWTAPQVDEDEVWTIIYTSGTTGTPKGVQASHRNVLASIVGIVIAHGVGPDSRCLTVLPTFHVAGLNVFANPVLLMGGTVLVARTFDPAQALRLLRDELPAVTHFGGVPANYQFIEQLPNFTERPLRPFVGAIGGSPVPESLLASWRAHGAALSTVFGITEAGACVASVPSSVEDAGAGVVGIPVLHARCRIRGERGETLEAGQVGQLEVAGDVVTAGYWRNAEATAEACTADGWLRTGDAGSIDADGRVRLVDRWKDMYISGGENVYPAEVENVLAAHPGVAQVAVVGVPDATWGEVGIAYVMAAAGAACSTGELIGWCNERLARYKVPHTVVLVADLPRNATGKTLKGELRARAAQYVTP
ncbi:class I adenylate-forming enzyme family protein [Aeromicrobium fastidiosum]|uniref:Long-chain fatty acid--CoA ligase n=1 Tax=Aeromicrobium fastidiosum TaxID=52699 RepID=A0A641AJB9_9ACTN|nr:AMP-binding protein [Aeromicrobium fastidiosum]KAA1374798.1 long-chain fatty acid--CoA ligase [Aeromicrobium fastidiosum]MBP2390651.1 fatty-acyl-CoA synthase [Aeromicrobium fastidiosum]